MTAYDPQNVFGKILRGEIPSVKVYEDEAVLATMDIFPQSRGHVLVIPKAPSRNLLDADPGDVALVAAYLPKLARAVKDATGADGIRLAQYNEAAAGQTVFHLHFHLIPVYAGHVVGSHGSAGQADTGELKALAELIAARLS